MIGVDVGSGDRSALGVPAQFRMATTEQMHLANAPAVRIGQTLQRLARLHVKGPVDRIMLPQAGQMRGCFPTSYDAQLACEWPQMRRHRPSRTMSDPTTMRLKAHHTLTLTALAFLDDAAATMCASLMPPCAWPPGCAYPSPSLKRAEARKVS